MPFNNYNLSDEDVLGIIEKYDNLINLYSEINGSINEDLKQEIVIAIYNYIKMTRKKKQFKNNVDDLILKNKHIEASNELSKRKRLNNMGYRNWNKSAYEYNFKRKGFEFKKELGRSYDVPKFIKVEV